MIHRLTIKDPAQTPVAWLPKVPALQKPRTFEFTPGLNILWGGNGSGKTTLALLLARLFHCEQSNQPVVTQESVRPFVATDIDIEAGIDLTHDGQGVRHFDPGHAVGLIGGMAGFDWDFGFAGIQNATFKGSAGQTTMFRFDQIVTEIITGEVPTVAYRIRRKDVNDLWVKGLDTVARLLAPTPTKPQGNPTIILDEPERSCDLPTQVALWRMLRAYAPDVQFIVASHSLFALNLPEANYIELVPGYLKKSRDALALLQDWPLEKPAKVSEKAVARTRAKAKPTKP